MTHCRDTARSPAGRVRAPVRAAGGTRRPSTATSPTPSPPVPKSSHTATTRRGLYVGVTRGRDDNLICVITESNDVAEARDVLEAILAIDRADVPAVTQRRNLAAQHRSQPDAPIVDSPRPGRCRIPDWFAELYADARHDLAAAEHTVKSRPPNGRDGLPPSPKPTVTWRTSIGRRRLTARCSPSTPNEPSRPARPMPRRSATSPAVDGAAARGAP